MLFRSIGFFGAILLIAAVLSFTRGIQRLFEQTWELTPLSVRNSVNGLIWIGGLTLYLTLSGVLHTVVDDGLENVLASIALTPLVIGFLIWTAEILSAKRITRRELLPFGVVGAAVLGVYQVGADIYVPHLFDTYAARYGVIGAVFAMISALFGWMLALVGSAALGREVGLELDRIRDGIRPSDDEVSRQWAVVVSGARERRNDLRRRWRALRDRG